MSETNGVLPFPPRVPEYEPAPGWKRWAALLLLIVAAVIFVPWSMAIGRGDE